MHSTLLPTITFALSSLLTPTISYSQLLPREKGAHGGTSGLHITFHDQEGCHGNVISQSSGIYGTDNPLVFKSYSLSRDMKGPECLDFYNKGQQRPVVEIGRRKGCHTLNGPVDRWNFWTKE